MLLIRSQVEMPVDMSSYRTCTALSVLSFSPRSYEGTRDLIDGLAHGRKKLRDFCIQSHHRNKLCIQLYRL